MKTTQKPLTRPIRKNQSPSPKRRRNENAPSYSATTAAGIEEDKAADKTAALLVGVAAAAPCIVAGAWIERASTRHLPNPQKVERPSDGEAC